MAIVLKGAMDRMGNFDRTQIIVALIGAIATIIAAILGKRRGVPKKLKYISVLAAAVGILIFAALMWINQKSVEFTFPREGEAVEEKMIIRGRYENIGADEKIWLIVYPHDDNLYYPQSGPADCQTNGEWFCVCYIGTEENVKKDFDLIAVAAEEDAQEAFSAYVSRAQGDDWKGLKELPEGTVIYDRITVTRK